MTVDGNELAHSLRAWRERVSPAEAGLPVGPRRRVRGLRRQEVAQLAGLSVEYLARLEQGRASRPSASVLLSLARVLRLSDHERALLFRAADQAEPSDGQIKRHLTPSVQRILDRLTDTPVMVVDAAWQCITCNDFAYALAGDSSKLSERERNVAWTMFTHGPTRYVLAEAEEQVVREELVADLREARSRYPRDKALGALLEDLLAASPDFARMWEQRTPPPPTPATRTFLHPEVGLITVDNDILTVRDSDLRLIVFSAAPGSAAAAQLDLVATIGLQQFA